MSNIATFPKEECCSSTETKEVVRNGSVGINGRDYDVSIGINSSVAKLQRTLLTFVDVIKFVLCFLKIEFSLIRKRWLFSHIGRISADDLHHRNLLPRTFDSGKNFM